jgi:hypothetical protein
MTKNQWTLAAVGVVVVGLFLYAHRDWFAGNDIQIFHRVRPRGLLAGRRRAPPQGADSVMFEFDRKLKLTSLRVTPLSEIETNRFPQPIWNLVSDSNSLPTRGLVYGIPVPGMRPSTKGIVAKPLEPGVKYRLTIQAGSLKASHDFLIEPPPQ